MKIKARLMAVLGTMVFLFMGNAGVASALTVTVTTVSSGSLNNTSSYGVPVTFSAKVTPLAATGTVTFKDGATTLGTGTLSSGTATFSTSALSAGTHSNITAVYGGDTNDAASTSLSITQTVTKPTPPPLTFAPMVNYIEYTVRSVATGDFNGDGNLDLAVGERDLNAVTLLLGKGDGTFTANAAQAYYTVGSWPSSVVSGDFNGDGKLDLAVTNLTGNTVSVLLGDGHSNFAPHVDYTVGSSPMSVATGDFNGDGRLDLVVANEDGTVSVLLGKGDGTFAAKIDSIVGNVPQSVATGDFNGDGKLDVVVANGGGVSVLLGNGDGTFAAPWDYTIGSGCQSVVTGDFNGDGKLDIATANRFDGTVSVLLGNGDGTFTSPVNYAVGDEPFSLATGDFNGDGKIDLAIGYYDGNIVSILPGSGDGTFATPIAFSVGHGPWYVATGDFNGDGKIDLATGNALQNAVNDYSNSVSILLGATSTVTTVASSANLSTFGDSVTFTASVTPSATTGTVTFRDGTKILGTGNLSGGTATYSTSALSVGPHTITAVFDGDTNYSASTSSGITQTVNTSPFSIITAPANGAAISGTSYTITGTASDAGGYVVSVKVGITPSGGTTTWDTATGTTSWSYKWTLSVNGSYTIQAMVTDNTGNTATSGAVNITVDNALPTVSMTAPANNTLLKGTTATISGTALDAGSPGLASMQIGITPSGGTPTWYSATGTTSWSYKWTLPVNGSYTIQAMATDNAGNTATSGAVNVTVDNTLKVAITAPLKGALISAIGMVIKGTASDSGSGVANVQVGITDSLGTKAWYTATGTTSWVCKWQPTIGDDGSYAITTMVTDKAGNQNVSSRVSVTMDTIPPTSAIYPLPPANLNGTTYTINGTASDATSGVKNVQVGITQNGGTTAWHMAAWTASTASWSYQMAPA